MQYALAAIGALALIAIAGWLYAAKQKKRVGRLELENKVFRQEAEGHEREHKAIDEHASLGDLNDDAAVLRELGNQ